MATIERISEHLYRFTDTCNVYVVKDGQSALLIDAGSFHRHLQRLRRRSRRC